tara:strand:- start:4726 stop:4962 length:237 start_codon:yes stop_codon:yes gene_type:complete
MPHTGKYKQIFFTSNTLFSESFDYLDGPYLMSANSVSKDVLIEGYETVKVMEYDPEQEEENLAVSRKLAVGFLIGENE